MEHEELVFLERKVAIELESYLPDETFKLLFDNNEEEIKKFRKMRRKTGEDYNSEISERFPIRTKSMVRIIIEIEEGKGTSTRK